MTAWGRAHAPTGEHPLARERFEPMANQFLENIPGTRTQSLFEAAEGDDLDGEFTGETPMTQRAQTTPTPTQTPTWTQTQAPARTTTTTTTPSRQVMGQDEFVTNEVLGDPAPASVTVDES